MTWRVPSHRWLAELKYNVKAGTTKTGVVLDINHDPGRNAPLARVKFGREEEWILAPEGIRIGDEVSQGENAEIRLGNALPIGKIPEGTAICNIEATPEDGGRFARSSGTFGSVMTHVGDKTVVALPSKRIIELNARCMATIGTASGGDRKIKPFVKAGPKHFLKRARGKKYPVVSARSMNVLDHKFGGSHMGVPKTVSRHAPPGRKVGSIAARRTGRKKK